MNGLYWNNSQFDQETGSGHVRKAYSPIDRAEPVDESDDALRAAASVIVGRHAQARHHAQKIVGFDIDADLAGGDRSLEKPAKGGPESLGAVAFVDGARRAFGCSG